MRFVLWIVFVHSVHWIYIYSFVTWFSIAWSTWQAVVHFMTFFRFFVLSLLLSAGRDVSQWSIFAGANKNDEEVELSHRNVSIFSLSPAFPISIISTARRAQFRLIFCCCSPVTAQLNSKSKLTYVPCTHRKGTYHAPCWMFMPNAHRWWKLSSAVCFRLPPVESDLCMSHIRIDYIWCGNRQHIFVCANAPAVPFDDNENDRDGISLVDCERGQTFQIKKTRQRRAVCAIISNYFLLFGPFFPLEFLQQCPFRLVVCVFVANSKSHIFAQQRTQSDGKRKKWNDWLCHRTRSNEMPQHIPLRFYNRTRASEWVCSFTVYDYLLLSPRCCGGF